MFFTGYRKASGGNVLQFGCNFIKVYLFIREGATFIGKHVCSLKEQLPCVCKVSLILHERLLVRLSLSDFKDKFVLKRGMLVVAIVGLDNRATMDLDTTLKNLPLTPENICGALEQVCNIPIDDGVTFESGKISPIR
ncbi:MAG TPA: nucleotidyl transferase AbiEii/AbiGii toxin family protein [Candidatus Alectryocaccobium stercorigallinarum]|nr:nucleotidyl transferase AbiEii/AbiGii toxin family protein [Candidatus Alectryocaccobium stercorigallinarum]